MATQEERNKQMQQIIAKCCSDEAFKEKLVADPHATLAAEGVDIPEGVNINVLSNTAATFHLVIPAMTDYVNVHEFVVGVAWKRGPIYNTVLGLLIGVLIYAMCPGFD